jgi:hypothetical protein
MLNLILKTTIQLDQYFLQKQRVIKRNGWGQNNFFKIKLRVQKRHVKGDTPKSINLFMQEIKTFVWTE